MKALIIGAAGFVGNYLLQHIHETYDWDIAATKLDNEQINCNYADVYNLNIMDMDAILALLNDIQPDFIFYLAAQSSVSVSWTRPDLTVDINIKGCIHLFNALRQASHHSRVLLIGSGEEYGHILPSQTPVSEQTPLTPGNIYAATKACQNMLGSIYARAYGLDIIMVRAFNHIGPRQAPTFVVSDFCRQVALIEDNRLEPVIKVGNLNALRDFTDVRDVVRAYGLLIQTGKPGETYNIGSGQAIAIQTILDKVLQMSSSEIRVEVDAQKLRPVDVPIIEADISKLQECIPWQPEITLEQTIKETLDYWRLAIKE